MGRGIVRLCGLDEGCGPHPCQALLRSTKSTVPNGLVHSHAQARPDELVAGLELSRGPSLGERTLLVVVEGTSVTRRLDELGHVDVGHPFSADFGHGEGSARFRGAGNRRR